MDAEQTRNILEACLLVAGRAMSLSQLETVFAADIDRPDRNEIKAQLLELQASYEGRGIELIEVASGWRLQSRSSMEHWVARLFQEKTPRYSRALLETLVLIAYRQPITRGEIEEVRGVAVSSNIIKTLQEREWVKEVGYKEVPGRPALLGTTRQFLDYFNLKRLDELPSLGEIKDIEEIDSVLAAEIGLVDGAAGVDAANADSVTDGTEGSEVSEVSEGSDALAVTGDAETSDGPVAENAAAADDDSGGQLENDVAADDASDDQPESVAAVEVSDEQPEHEDAADVGGMQTDDGSPVDDGSDGQQENAVAADDASAESDSDSAADDGGDEQLNGTTDEEGTVEDGGDGQPENAGAVDDASDEPDSNVATDDGNDEQSNDAADDGASTTLSSIAGSAAEPPLLSDSENDAENDGENPVDAKSDQKSSSSRNDNGDESVSSQDIEQVDESDAQSQLKRVIDDFASEHQQELDAQQEIDSLNLKTVSAERDAPADGMQESPRTDHSAHSVTTTTTTTAATTTAAALVPPAIVNEAVVLDVIGDDDIVVLDDAATEQSKSTITSRGNPSSVPPDTEP